MSLSCKPRTIVSFLACALFAQHIAAEPQGTQRTPWLQSFTQGVAGFLKRMPIIKTYYLQSEFQRNLVQEQMTNHEAFLALSGQEKARIRLEQETVKAEAEKRAVARLGEQTQLQYHVNFLNTMHAEITAKRLTQQDAELREIAALDFINSHARENAQVRVEARQLPCHFKHERRWPYAVVSVYGLGVYSDKKKWTYSY